MFHPPVRPSVRPPRASDSRETGKPSNENSDLLETIVREYVFYVFFENPKTRLFTFFEV